MNNFEKILNEFKNLDYKKIEKEKTFLETIKMSHKETIYSNILAFYLDVNAEHDLKNLMVKALINAALIKIEDDIFDIQVEREYYTNKGNFIDIVLYNDNIAIGIENKIDSLVYNDLNDYKKTVEGLAPKAYLILLSLNDEYDVAKNNRCINVTYKQLCDELKQLIINVSDKNNKWHIYLNDFIKGIENLYDEGKSVMNDDIIKWTSENKQEINKIYNFLMSFKEEINYKTAKVEELLKDSTHDYNFIDYIWRWNKSGLQDKDFKLYTICVVEIKRLKIAIDNYLDADGWKIELSYRGKAENRNKNEIIKILNEKKINYDFYDKTHIRIFTYDYNTDYKQIIKSNIEILEILKQCIKN